MIYDHKLRLFGGTLLENTPYYDSRVVIYDRRGFLRLATGYSPDVTMGNLINALKS